MAMRLHTRDQAPKEGEREAAEQAWKQVSLVQQLPQPQECLPLLFWQAFMPLKMCACFNTAKRCCACTLQWQPSREGYLRFLTESKEVYETLEGIVAEAHHPDCEHSPLRYYTDLTVAAVPSSRHLFIRTLRAHAMTLTESAR